jgi:phage-related protein
MAVHTLDGQKNVLKALETDLSATYGQQLETLEQHVDALLTTAEHTLADLLAQSTQITNDYIDAVHHLRDTLDQARQAADAVAKTATTALTDAKTVVDEMNKKREADVAQITQTLQQLEQSFNDVETQATNAYNEVLQHAQPLITAVHDGTTQLHTQGDAMTQGLLQVEQNFAGHVQTIAQALHDLGQQIQSDHQSHDHTQDQNANATQQQASTLIAQNVSTLASGLQGVDSAMSVLTEYVDGFGGSFGEGAKGLLNTVGEISHIVDAIKPVIEAIQAIA